MMVMLQILNNRKSDKKMKAKIFFSDFDYNEINASGWQCEEGKLYLALTDPLNNRSIDAIDDCLEKKKFKYIGEIDAKNENEVWARIQNVNSSHELNNRSMMVGDIIVFETYGVVVESTGFSELSGEQIEKFKKIK